MARSRVKLAWIQKRSARKSAFKNRSSGLLTKVEELCILCCLPGLLIIFNSETNLLTVWPNLQDAEELLKRYMSLPVYVRRRKMKNIQSFLKERVTSMQEERTKLLKKINEMEMNDSIDQIERIGKLFDELSLHKLTDIDSFLKEKMDKIKELIAYRIGNHKGSPSPVTCEHLNSSYDHIIGKIGRHPSASLFSSLKRQKGSSSSSIVKLQSNPCNYDDIVANDMELPLASNNDPFRIGDMEWSSYALQFDKNTNDFGINLDKCFNDDGVNRGTVGINTGFNAGNEEGLPLGLVGGAKNWNYHDDELPFDFTKFLRSRSSSPSLD